MTFHEGDSFESEISVVGQIVEINQKLITMLADEPLVQRQPLLLATTPDMMVYETPQQFSENELLRQIYALDELHKVLSGTDIESFSYQDSRDEVRYWEIPRSIGNLYVVERYQRTNSGTLLDVSAYVSTQPSRRYLEMIDTKKPEQGVLAIESSDNYKAQPKWRKWGRAIVNTFTEPLNNPPKRTTH